MPVNQNQTISIIKEVAGGLGAAFIFFLLVQLREWIWLLNVMILAAVLYWLNKLEFDGGFLRPRSCVIPSVAFVVAFHMSIWRLPLISIDLYRTMINPFLEFEKSIIQYDVCLCCYLIVVGVVFVSVQSTYKVCVSIFISPFLLIPPFSILVRFEASVPHIARWRLSQPLFWLRSCMDLREGV